MRCLIFLFLCQFAENDGFQMHSCPYKGHKGREGGRKEGRERGGMEGRKEKRKEGRNSLTVFYYPLILVPQRQPFLTLLADYFLTFISLSLNNMLLLLFKLFFQFLALDIDFQL